MRSDLFIATIVAFGISHFCFELMAPKKMAGYSGDDTSCDALIAELLAMDLNDDIPQNVAGSSTDTLEEVQKRLKTQAEDIGKRRKVVMDLLKEKGKTSAADIAVSITLKHGDHTFNFNVSVNTDISIGDFRAMILIELNKLLRGDGQKPLPKASSRVMTLVINGRDVTLKARSILRTYKVDANSTFVVSFPNDVLRKFHLPASDDEANDAEEEEEEERDEDDEEQ